MTRPINPGRLILATILAPLLGTLVISGLWLLFIMDAPPFGSTSTWNPDDIGGPQYGWNFNGLFALTLAGSIFVGWPAMLVLGLPLHGLLCHKDKRYWYTYAGAGATAGLVAMLILAIILDGIRSVPLFFLASGIAAGALTALLFHLIRGPHQQTDVQTTQAP